MPRNIKKNNQIEILELKKYTNQNEKKINYRDLKE